MNYSTSASKICTPKGTPSGKCHKYAVLECVGSLATTLKVSFVDVSRGPAGPRDLNISKNQTNGRLSHQSFPLKRSCDWYHHHWAK